MAALPYIQVARDGLPEPLTRCARCDRFHAHREPCALPVRAAAPLCGACNDFHAAWRPCKTGQVVLPRGVPEASWLDATDGICRVAGCACPHHERIDFELLEAYGFDPRALKLSPTETRLLIVLLPPGRLAAKEVLIRRVWGQEYDGEYHLLRVNLSRLRSKLSASWHLANFNTLGYRLSPVVGSYHQ